MHTIQNTLYVMTPHAYAHLENATVRIDVEHENEVSSEANVSEANVKGAARPEPQGHLQFSA